MPISSTEEENCRQGCCCRLRNGKERILVERNTHEIVNLLRNCARISTSVVFVTTNFQKFGFCSHPFLPEVNQQVFTFYYDRYPQIERFFVLRDQLSDETLLISDSSSLFGLMKQALAHCQHLCPL